MFTFTLIPKDWSLRDAGWCLLAGSFGGLGIATGALAKKSFEEGNIIRASKLTAIAIASLAISAYAFYESAFKQIFPEGIKVERLTSPDFSLKVEGLTSPDFARNVTDL